MENAESPSGVEPNLNELALDMFQKSAQYIEAELAVAQDDYKLLTELNKECDMTYAGLRKIGGNLNKQLKEMTEKHAALKPYLEMIDSINESTSKLEAVAYMMDTYTKRLEDVVKAKRKVLHDTYRKELGKMPEKQSEDDAFEFFSSWSHFKSLEFLRDQFTPRLAAAIS